MSRKSELKTARKVAKATGTDSDPRYRVKVSKMNKDGEPLDGTFFLVADHWKAKYKKFKRIIDGKAHDHGRARYA